MKNKVAERKIQDALPLTELTAISPVDGRYRKKVEVLAPYVSEYGLIKNRLEIEAKFLITLSDVGAARQLTSQERRMLTNLSSTISLSDADEVKKIEQETRHDVKAMERVMRGMFSGTSLEDLTEKIHFGLTSEDINNIAYRLILKRSTKNVVLPEIENVILEISDRANRYAAVPMLARTHGQAAVPTTIGKEFSVFALRLAEQVQKLKAAKLQGKLNGAVGNYNALNFAFPNIDWVKASEKFVMQLDLEPSAATTQINPYDDIVEYFQNYHRINSIILDLDADMWRYISDDWFAQKINKGETGSSTMPQKVNPIDFENSEGNVAIANGLIEVMARKLPVSRLQRDLSDSTTIRNTGIILAHSLLAYKSLGEGLSRSAPNEAQISKDLNKNWNILGEAAQTLLRNAGVKDPYTLIASLTKGHQIDAKSWTSWVMDLPVKKQIKNRLLKLTPETYTGEAARIARETTKKVKKLLKNET